MLRRTARVLCTGRFNTMQQAEPGKKVVNKIPLDDVIEKVEGSAGGRVIYCRCWKSKTFPYCDGAHNEHNDATGDNIGPLIITE